MNAIETNNATVMNENATMIKIAIETMTKKVHVITIMVTEIIIIKVKITVKEMAKGTVRMMKKARTIAMETKITTATGFFYCQQSRSL
jgi:hypothetical protein